MTLNIRWLMGIDWLTTIRANFSALEFSSAVKLPILFERGSHAGTSKGSIAFECPIHFGIVRFAKQCSLDVGGRVVFKGAASFGHDCAMYIAPGAELILGRNLNVTSGISLNCLKQISIGSDVVIAWRCTILDGDFHPIRDATGAIINPNRAIDIKDRVWIGNNVLILKGVTIASGSVVGAGSVVSRSLPDESCVYAGSPARKLKENISWSPE